MEGPEGNGLNDREAEGVKQAGECWRWVRDAAASEDRAKSAGYGASHANNERMNFNSSSAVSKELKTY